MVAYNKKLEEDPRDSGRSDPKYPHVSGKVDVCGGEKVTYADPNNRGKEFDLHFDHAGGFQIRENATDDKKGLTNTLDHHARSYASGGSSSNSDGHIDQSTLLGASIRVNTNDHGTSASGDIHSGAAGSKISSIAGSVFEHNGQGSVAAYKDGQSHSNYTKGTISNHHEGDVTSTIVGNKYEGIESGDKGLHVQGGNFDIQIDGGKYRLSTGSDILVQSATSLTIKVGSSTIVLSPSGIVVTASSVQFVKA